MLPPRTEGDFQASDRIARPPPLDSKRPSDSVLLKTSFFEFIFDFNFHQFSYVDVSSSEAGMCSSRNLADLLSS